MPGWRAAFAAAGSAAGALPDFRVGALLLAPVSWLPAIAQLGGLLAAAYAAGWPAPRLLRAGPSVRVPLQLVFGWSAISLLNHGGGLAGLTFPSLIRIEAVALVTGGVVLAVRDRAWREVRWPGGEERLPWLLVGVLLLACFMLTRLPDTHDDPRIYHFAFPEHCLLLHKINAEPQNAFFHIPLAGEMIFLPALALGGIKLAKLVNIAVVLAGMTVLVRMARELGPRAGAWAALGVVSAGVVFDVCWQGKNDLVATVWLLAAMWCGMAALRGSGRWLAGFGWFLGAALSAKLTAGMAAAGAAVAVAGFGLRRFRLPAWFAAAAAGVPPLAGWLAASWLFVGNPAHPFLHSVFPGIGWNSFLADAIRFYDDSLRPLEARLPSDVLAGVWRVFGDPALGSFGLFAVLPAAFLAARGRGPAGMLKTAALVAYVLWAAMGVERLARYYFPAFPFVALLAGAYVAETESRGRAVRTVLALATVAVILAGAGARMLCPHGGLYLAGQLSDEEFIEKRYTTFEEVRRWVNRKLPATARINMSGEDRQLGFHRRVRGYSFVTAPLFWELTRDSLTVEEVVKRVRQQGVTHQLHNAIGAEFRAAFSFPGPEWTDRQLKLFQGVVRRHFKPVHVPDRADTPSGAFYVFEITRAAGEYPVVFLPFTEGRFRRARLLMIADRPQEALAEAERVAEPVRDVLQTRLVLGTIHARLGDYAEAVRLLEPGVRGGFVSMWHRWNLSAYGSSAANAGRHDDGLAALERGYRVSGDTAFLESIALTLVARGQAREGRGEIASAMEDLKRAVPLLKDSELKAQVEEKIGYLSRGRGGTL